MKRVHFRIYVRIFLLIRFVKYLGKIWLNSFGTSCMCIRVYMHHHMHIPRAKYAGQPIEPITDGSRRDRQNEHDRAIHDINRSECTPLDQ